MIRYLFVVINSLSLFILSLFGGGGITVTSNIPATIIAGQDVAIEIKVNKGNMNGFAKLQLELPEGIVVKESEAQGATYSYNDGIAKWVWSLLPAGDEMIVKVMLVAADNAVGAKTITGKYSYVENNEKQVVEMAPAEVTVLAVGSTAAITKDTTSTPKENVPASAVTSNEPQANVSAMRNITMVNDHEYLVNIKIHKGLTKGFAKYSDDAPEGLTAKAVKTDGSSFSVSDGKIKFVWVNVPVKENLEISYTLNGTFKDAVILVGEYSYLENNQSKKYLLNNETSKDRIQPPVVVKQEEKKEEAPKEPETKTQPQEQLTTDVPKEEKTPRTDATIEKKESNTQFLVQIGAFTNAIDASRLKRKFKITESIKSEMQNGYSKFMVGSHAEYKAAREHRETMRNGNGVRTAFVVAYNGARRITVQEALMISNQKWFR